MGWPSCFRTKSIEQLLAEQAGDQRLHRVLGPIGLTSIGIGAIIGAGIFVMTGRAAALDAGPAVVLSYCVAALGCLFAALCYAEFASTTPVAGSAYTYSFATLGEVMAWIIGWDLILEYGMSCATVASAWSHYFNALLEALRIPQMSPYLTSDPFTVVPGYAHLPVLFTIPGIWGMSDIVVRPTINLPAMLIMGVITAILVRGIRESVTSNTILVVIKLAVVLLVLVVGFGYVAPANWTSIPVTERVLPNAREIPNELQVALRTDNPNLSDEQIREQLAILVPAVSASYQIHYMTAEIARLEQGGKLTAQAAAEQLAGLHARFGAAAATLPADSVAGQKVLQNMLANVEEARFRKWGMIGKMGLNSFLGPIDDATRSPFMPYGISGMMLGASIVFFAYIGFDAISTNAEEAKNPQRDLPIGILLSLVVCTLLYIGVSAVITGMVPYPLIDDKAAVATAFTHQAEVSNTPILKWATVLIALGGLAGMTSVLLVTFLAQARIFMAMARDGLLPKIFAEVHPQWKTPHKSTLMVGVAICLIAGLTPISILEEMVNIGTLLAFVIVCGTVLVLRIQRPELHRPFRCPLVFVVAPLGIFVNVILMLFLNEWTWLRLVGWLGLGLVIYFAYGYWHSTLQKNQPQSA